MSAVKLPACTVAKKHAWEFVKDVTTCTQHFTGAGMSATFKFRAQYKCACGAKKIGALP